MLKKVLKNGSALQLLFFTCLFMAQVTWASSFIVKKVKGKQALIEYTGPQLENGKSYLLNSSSDGEPTADRSHFFVLREFSLTSLTTTVSGTSGAKVTLFNVLFGYGWNFENFEFSPLYGFKLVDSGNGSTSNAFTLGGLVDYNFTKNIAGNNSLWGVSAEVTYEKANGNGSLNSPATTILLASGFWKWFVFGPSAGLRFDLGYINKKVTTTFDNIEAGLYSQGSFAIYF